MKKRKPRKLRTIAAPAPAATKSGEKLLGDKGYDTDAIRDVLEERGIEPVILPRPNRTEPIEYDREAYKRRNLIERCVNALKQFRCIATRYDKTAKAIPRERSLGTVKAKQHRRFWASNLAERVGDS